jgi:hypothetical protein
VAGKPAGGKAAVGQEGTEYESFLFWHLFISLKRGKFACYFKRKNLKANK